MLSKYFYNISVTIIGIVTSIFIFTTVGGLFHIPVNPFFILIPFIGGLYYLKKQSAENIDFLKQFLILLLIIMFSYIISISIWDVSWDGRWYHSAALVMYKNGWLPIYDKYITFADNYHLYRYSAFWVKCYTNFIEIIGANIYKITNLIESSKATNFIILSTIFMYSYSVLRKFKPEKKFISIIISLVILLNPVCIYQWFTNYIDLHIYIAFTLLILTIIKIELQQNASKTDLFMFICSSLILAMTKLTGCAYLFIIILIYFINLFLLKKKVKKYIKTVLFIGGLIFLTGISPFYTNLRNYGHPFHPVFGKNKIDISSINTPYSFKEKNIAEKFFISTFSESLNSMERDNMMKIVPKLKIPFTINKESIFNYFYCADIRIGGFGYYWSGILLLSLIYLPFIRFRNNNEKYLFWLIIMMVIASTIINPECWWARYVPQLWLFPAFIMIFGFLQEDFKSILSEKIKKTVLTLLVIVCIINSLIIIKQNTDFNMCLTKFLKIPYNYIDSIKPKNSKIYIMKLPEWENMEMTDETIIPHLEDFYGKDNIINVSFDEKKVMLGEFIPIQKRQYVVTKPCYFYKIGE